MRMSEFLKMICMPSAITVSSVIVSSDLGHALALEHAAEDEVRFERHVELRYGHDIVVDVEAQHRMPLQEKEMRHSLVLRRVAGLERRRPEPISGQEAAAAFFVGDERVAKRVPEAEEDLVLVGVDADLVDHRDVLGAPVADLDAHDHRRPRDREGDGAGCAEALDDDQAPGRDRRRDEGGEGPVVGARQELDLGSLPRGVGLVLERRLAIDRDRLEHPQRVRELTEAEPHRVRSIGERREAMLHVLDEREGPVQRDRRVVVIADARCIERIRALQPSSNMTEPPNARSRPTRVAP